MEVLTLNILSKYKLHFLSVRYMDEGEACALLKVLEQSKVPGRVAMPPLHFKTGMPFQLGHWL